MIRERRFKSVAVLMGGGSTEHEISLISGEAVVAGLREAGYEVEPVVMVDRDLHLPDSIEAVFIAMHGGFGENGGLQEALNQLGVPYTGPGPKACTLTMDKAATRDALQAGGVRVPQGLVVGPDDDCPLNPPVVVKPPLEGSSFGLHLVRSKSEWAAAVADTCRYDGNALVEAFIPGREWTVGILGDRALPVVQIDAPGGWYDFNSKYRSGGTRYAFPEADDAGLCARCRAVALDSFRLTGCRGVARVDFRVTNEGALHVLEINAIPGFTPTSLLPKAAKRDGLAFSELCAIIMEMAICDDGVEC